MVSGTSGGCIAGQVKEVFPRGVDKVLELIGSTTVQNSLRCTKQRGIVCMTGRRIQTGPVFKLEPVAEAHRCMEENKAGGKIVALTSIPGRGARSEPPRAMPHTARVPAAGIL